MTENSTVVSFPVVFFDGEREIDLGNINVHPSMEFKKFQSFLSQKIGISPNQISVSLIRRKPSKSPPGNRRKIPVTEKVDFSAILGEKDCFFYVTLMKRSRRERRGKPRRILEEENYLSPHPIDSAQEKAPPPEKILLRRDAGLVSPFYDQVTPPEYLYSGRGILGLGLVDYENQIRKLQAQREKYLMSTANTYQYSIPYPEYEDRYGYEGARGRVPKSNGVVVCEVCSNAKGRQVPFHWCVYDAVTVGFRSPAGPIARPAKRSV